MWLARNDILRCVNIKIAMRGFFIEVAVLLLFLNILWKWLESKGCVNHIFWHLEYNKIGEFHV